jgi:hypothetical protein
LKRDKEKYQEDLIINDEISTLIYGLPNQSSFPTKTFPTKTTSMTIKSSTIVLTFDYLGGHLYLENMCKIIVLCLCVIGIVDYNWLFSIGVTSLKAISLPFLN